MTRPLQVHVLSGVTATSRVSSVIRFEGIFGSTERKSVNQSIAWEIRQSIIHSHRRMILLMFSHSSALQASSSPASWRKQKEGSNEPNRTELKNWAFF